MHGVATLSQTAIPTATPAASVNDGAQLTQPVAHYVNGKPVSAEAYDRAVYEYDPPMDVPEVARRPRMDPAQWMSLCFTLLARGYILEMKAVMRGSFHATVRNQLDRVVGDITYRDPQDEPNDYAQGISYGSHVSDPEFDPDITFKQVMEAF